jgi:hypothetical protein
MARPAISLSVLHETVLTSDLTESSKKHLSYCIHRFARLLGRGLDMEINETLLFHRPDLHSAGLTAGSLANIRSGVRAALRLTNRIGPETQSRAWVGAIDRAKAWNGPGRRRILMCLPPFARYCTAIGIGPDHVSASTFSDYEKYSAGMLVRNPGLRARQAWDAWNHAARAIHAWPGPVVERARRALFGLPLSELPEALVAELTAYAARKGLPTKPTDHAQPASGAGVFLALADQMEVRRRATGAEEGKSRRRILRPLSDASVHDHLHAVRHVASAALRSGRPPDSLLTLDQVATRALAAEAAAEIRQKANGAYTKRLYKLFCQIRDVRARWVGTDDEWLRLHATALAVRGELEKQGVHVSVMSEKTRQRLSTFESPTAVMKLISLPKQLIERAEARRKAGQPVRYRDAVDVAVAIALLIEFTKPVRLGNLVELERDWLRLPDRRDEPGSLAIPGHRVKTGEPLFATLPAHKVKAIKLFITHYRTYLTDQPECRWLFPSQAGDAHKQEGRMGKLIVNRVYALTGLVINVHLLRGITAALLYRRTRSLDDVRSLLGHSKDSQSHQFYLYLQQRTASMVLDEAIEAELGEITPAKQGR